MSSSHNSAAFAGLAQAPVATMGSVSSASTMGATRSANAVQSMATAMTVAQPVKGIYTAATAVSGGVTTYDKAPMKPGRGVRKDTNPLHPDNPTPCPTCTYDENGECIYCEHDLYDELVDGHCDDDGCEGGCCCTPLELNWGAMVFLMLLAVGYAMWKKNRHTMPDNGRC